jgi:D-2-hydroxyglutarate dehydrogenase
VGGATPISNEVIISISNLDKIIEFDQRIGVLTCEAGCILENINQYIH